jgi:LCP family protein required for cell wall assembly
MRKPSNYCNRESGSSVLKATLWTIMIGLLISVIWLGLTGWRRAGVGSPLSVATDMVKAPIASLSEGFLQLGIGKLSHPTTILFLGTDVVYEKRGRHLEVDRGACSGNSDTMLLAFLNPEHERVSVMHIPRDTEAYVGNRGIQKINSANALGGPELAKTSVTSLLDVPVDHYLVMNIQGLVQLVNELGGITVHIPKKMNYMDWTAKLKIDLEPGVHTLTGNQAMGFVRFRHDALGDIGRIQRQQIFLQAAWQKMLNPSSWVHIPALMGIAQQNIRTDMTNTDLLEILHFICSVPKDNVRFVMLPGQFAGNGDWIANTDGRALAARLAYPDQDWPESRKNITVRIVNASSKPALGAQLAGALRKLGYLVTVGRDEDYPVTSTTRIIAQNGNSANARMVQQDLGGVGEVINASVGNLYSSITLVAHDDIKLADIKMSSVDAPYMVHMRPQPIVAKSFDVARSDKKLKNQLDMQPSENILDTNSKNLLETGTESSISGAGSTDLETTKMPNDKQTSDALSPTVEDTVEPRPLHQRPPYEERSVEAPEPEPSQAPVPQDAARNVIQ